MFETQVEPETAACVLSLRTFFLHESMSIFLTFTNIIEKRPEYSQKRRSAVLTILECVVVVLSFCQVNDKKEDPELCP